MSYRKRLTRPARPHRGRPGNAAMNMAGPLFLASIPAAVGFFVGALFGAATGLQNAGLIQEVGGHG